MPLHILAMLLTLGVASLADAADTASKQTFCTALDQLDQATFEPLSALIDSGANSPQALGMSDALSTCGFDYSTLLDRYCQKAYRLEDVAFILRHCPNEAWSLARAQCERNLDSISPRFYELCIHFGRAVTQ
jgi:hypothetical protein